MNKRLILVLAFALVVGLSFTAYAEVQNVKVSGDLTVMGVARDNFDLSKTPEPRVNETSNNTLDDHDRDILSIARVRVDADLTDNVTATVRLLNERVWNGDSTLATQANRNIGLNTQINNNDNRDSVNIDLAYVTLKEFLYSPLSLKIGRQELRFGNGFIVGDPDTNIYSAVTNLSEGDLSARKSFDALRATLDYNPLVVDLVYAKTQSGAANLHDDVDLVGGNASYELNKDTTLEGFFFSKITGTNAPATWNVDSGSATYFTNTLAGSFKDESDIVNTVGVRATNKTVKNLAVDGQVAYQFGRYNPKYDPNARVDATGGGANGMNNTAKTGPRSAWAAQLMANYDLKDAKYVGKYNPILKASYTYLSGENRDNNKRTHKGWDTMFEDQSIGHIMNAIFADTNMHKMGLGAKAKVTDDITANFDYVAAWFAKKIPSGRSWVPSGIATTAATARRFISTNSGESFMGNEFDAVVTYDYTEDVQFALLGGIFLPNKTIQETQTGTLRQNQSAAATELIGSMKVTF